MAKIECVGDLIKKIKDLEKENKKLKDEVEFLKIGVNICKHCEEK